jgi:hypothetical protein
MARDDLGVDVVAVERAVSGERGHRPVDPVEQGTGLGAVVGIMAGQRRRDDPPGVGVRGETKLLPSPTPPGAVLLDQPFAGAAELQARAVHQQVHRRTPRFGRGTSSVSARRLRVLWSGTGRSRPSRRIMDPIRPSVWRRARRNTARKVKAVVMASAE